MENGEGKKEDNMTVHWNILFSQEKNAEVRKNKIVT